MTRWIKESNADFMIRKEDYHTNTEAAAVLKISRPTLHGWARRRKIKFYLHPETGQFLYLKKDVEAMVKQREQESAPMEQKVSPVAIIEKSMPALVQFSSIDASCVTDPYIHACAVFYLCRFFINSNPSKNTPPLINYPQFKEMKELLLDFISTGNLTISLRGRITKELQNVILDLSGLTLRENSTSRIRLTEDENRMLCCAYRSLMASKVPKNWRSGENNDYKTIVNTRYQADSVLGLFFSHHCYVEIDNND